MTYQPPDYLVPCAHCGKPHVRRFERYECSGCGETVCSSSSFAWNGRKWNRDGELVHLARTPGYQENPPVTRVCGTLTRVEDWKPEEEAPSGEAEPAGAEVPGVRESVSAKEGESEALPGRV